MQKDSGSANPHLEFIFFKKFLRLEYAWCFGMNKWTKHEYVIYT